MINGTAKFNLVNEIKSDVKFKKVKFPDGQQDIVIENGALPALANGGVTIISRFKSFLDLELIVCAVAALRELDPDMDIHLDIPYLLGARSDRKFQEGGTWYLKDVLTPIINSLNFKSVELYDPHSTVSTNLIKRVRVTPNYSIVQHAIDMFYCHSKSYVSNTRTGKNVCDREELTDPDFIVISPDAGALHKIYKSNEAIKFKGETVTCMKERDKDGKISNVVVPKQDFGGKDVFIIDDICDGGRTFIEIAEAIKKRNTGKVNLVVSHGIFSKGFEVLSQCFDNIYVTNSVSDLNQNATHRGNGVKWIYQLNII